MIGAEIKLCLSVNSATENFTSERAAPNTRDPSAKSIARSPGGYVDDTIDCLMNECEAPESIKIDTFCSGMPCSDRFPCVISNVSSENFDVALRLNEMLSSTCSSC